MVFQSTAAFHHLSSYMVHPTKLLASVGLAQARPNNLFCVVHNYQEDHGVVTTNLILGKEIGH